MSKKQFFATTITSALVGGMVAVGSMFALQDDNAMTLSEYKESQNVRLASYLESGDFTVPEGLNFVYAAEVAPPRRWPGAPSPNRSGNISSIG